VGPRRVELPVVEAQHHFCAARRGLHRAPQPPRAPLKRCPCPRRRCRTRQRTRCAEHWGRRGRRRRRRRRRRGRRRRRCRRRRQRDCRRCARHRHQLAASEPQSVRAYAPQQHRPPSSLVDVLASIHDNTLQTAAHALLRWNTRDELGDLSKSCRGLAVVSVKLMQQAAEESCAPPQAAAVRRQVAKQLVLNASPSRRVPRGAGGTLEGQRQQL
jgi:hypothetical protein